MSSATSTEAKAQPERDASMLDRVPWMVVTPSALGIAAAIYLFAIMEPRAPLSAGSVFLVVAAASFGLVAIQVWKVVATLVAPKTPSETRVAPETVLRRRRELEREKAAILKAIKELEFDRAMNKISEEDYKEAHANYRQRAVRIMVQLDEGGSGYREIIEREVRERLERRGAKRPEPVEKPAPPAVEKDRSMCSCGTRNDADATFCKKCGAKL